jgi:hypothetical protein
LEGRLLPEILLRFQEEMRALAEPGAQWKPVGGYRRLPLKMDGPKQQQGAEIKLMGQQGHWLESMVR